jgi:hypothetical protein
MAFTVAKRRFKWLAVRVPGRVRMGWGEEGEERAERREERGERREEKEGSEEERRGGRECKSRVPVREGFLRIPNNKF